MASIWNYSCFIFIWFGLFDLSRAARNNRFHGNALQNEHYKLDQSITVAEIHTDTRIQCANQCLLRACKAFLWKYSTASDDRCFSVDTWQYSGTWARTKSGIACQRWDSQFPQEHSTDHYNMPESSLTDAKNYCRDPSRAGNPWCYTVSDAKRWERCNLHRCFSNNNNCRLYGAAGSQNENVDGLTYMVMA
ncbi:PLMN-like protein [Mya arenaria]|uniref:PLMN-like protein n=1 Tax=Mya arenaria TaxID=6604 RepID=A0ABY7EV60_MYAAR|nr:plasminogen-like [Mya arenaria]WAR13180.1 PLMN-like protein [Mya arenaria]